MRLPHVQLPVRRTVLWAALSWLFVSAIVPSGHRARAQEVGGADIRADSETTTGPRRPLSAQAARTWIALHESRIRPLPGRTPLRQVLRALREATRGKAGWAEGVDFNVVPVALLEAEITLDAPVTLPFAGRPEV